jgi:predicted AlkP superfamily pyrophosphatase or phosphodiesterase
MKRWLLFIASFAIALGSLAAQTPGPARYVILITIDGMRGDYIAAHNPHGLKIPHLRDLIARGSVSARTISVFPTLTGTAHTSLVTGARAIRHGILGNNRFDPSIWAWDEDNYDRQPPYRDHALIKTPTLWSVARSKGLKTAAVAWPQTFGGPIDYALDILPARTTDESHARIVKSASPGWFDNIEARLGTVAALDGRMADHWKATVAAQIVREFHPAFMAVHFSITDAAQHAEGPGTPNALAAVEESDQNIGILLAAIDGAGLRDRTVIFVTGDHGFVQMHTQLAINLPLVEAGLIERDPQGHPRWQAIVAPNRGLGSLYLKDPKDQTVLGRAREALERYEAQYPGRFRLLSRAELDRMGADRDALLGVEPTLGYVLDARLGPPFAMAHERAAGHGYSPELPDMQTGLIVAGAGIRRGVVLPVTQTIDVAPTIAQILGLDLGNTDGRPIVGVLEREKK